MTLEDVILIFLRDLKNKLCKHNKKEVEPFHYIKVYSKGMLKNGFVYAEISDANLLYQLSLKSLTHQRDFDLKYIPNIFYFSILLDFCTVIHNV